MGVGHPVERSGYGQSALGRDRQHAEGQHDLVADHLVQVVDTSPLAERAQMVGVGRWLLGDEHVYLVVLDVDARLNPCG